MKKKSDGSVRATATSTLATDYDHIREFAFDGDSKTYFESEKNPTASDSFTLTFDKPVAVKSIAVATGEPGGEDKLDSGSLEVSADGKTFEKIGKFADGKVKARAAGRKILAVRVQPTEELKHPLVIREFTIDSTPKVAVFEYPVEYVISTDDPEMKPWLEKCARVCEREYPLICEALSSPGFKPAHVVHMTLRKNYRGVAATGGTHITGAVKWFKDHPKDVGAMVHESVHVVQAYHHRGNPGWLVEGIADYIRFFKYEPGKAGPVNPRRAHYNGSYRVTATFLDYVSRKYDKNLVHKLNAAMREGNYSSQIFKDATGKTLEQLDDEWRATLKR